MSKKMDKLVEEIGDIVTESISALLAPSTDEEYSRVKGEISNRLIARIGKAYADGMLLPDEVWRTVAPESFQLWAKDERWLNVRKGDIVIVLREQEPK